jgi:hypothetical protein
MSLVAIPEFGMTNARGEVWIGNQGAKKKVWLAEVTVVGSIEPLADCTVKTPGR